jgi:hypothetical protein
MESMADLSESHFASVIGKSEVSDSAQSLRKSFGSLKVDSLTGFDCVGHKKHSEGEPQQEQRVELTHPFPSFVDPQLLCLK